jgi:predicted nucleic acid-binding protein
MTVLIDTNVLLALSALQDINHGRAVVAMRELTGERIIPAPVLPELFYLLAKHVNYAQAVKCL